jgi:hypothetical protein
MMTLFKEFKRKYPDFMPSKEVKADWLYSLKKEANIQNAPMPGLFQSENYSLMLAGVCLVLLLEIGATVISYRYGVSWGAIGAAIIIDFVLAFLAHKPQKSICLLQNKLFIQEDALVREQLRREISSKKLVKNFWFALIIMSGIFKFYWFYDVYRENLISIGLLFDAYTLLVLMCYLVGAALHIVCTGYMLFTSFFHYRVHKEETTYINSINKDGQEVNQGADRYLKITEFSDNPIINTTIELLPHSVGKHQLILDPKFDSTQTDSPKYVFKIWGLLLDEELRQFVTHQNFAAQRDVIARAGVSIQLDILEK